MFIHWVLPFTPVNPHPELRTKVASLVIGAVFLALARRSLTRPEATFTLAAGVLSLVFVVSAVTGATPASGRTQRPSM